MILGEGCIVSYNQCIQLIKLKYRKASCYIRVRYTVPFETMSAMIWHVREEGWTHRRQWSCHVLERADACQTSPGVSVAWNGRVLLWSVPESTDDVSCWSFAYLSFSVFHPCSSKDFDRMLQLATIFLKIACMMKFLATWTTWFHDIRPQE